MKLFDKAEYLKAKLWIGCTDNCKREIPISEFSIDILIEAESLLLKEFNTEATLCYIGNKVWFQLAVSDLIEKGMLVPSLTYQEIIQGKIGKLFNSTVWTDTYAELDKKLFDPLEIIFTNQEHTAFSYLKLT